jgi:hypothetical protein
MLLEMLRHFHQSQLDRDWGWRRTLWVVWLVQLTRIYQGLTMPKAGRVAFYRAGACWARELGCSHSSRRGRCQVCAGHAAWPPLSPNLTSDPNRGKVTAELSQEENLRTHLPPISYSLFRIIDEVFQRHIRFLSCMLKGRKKWRPLLWSEEEKKKKERRNIYTARAEILQTRDLHASYFFLFSNMS